MAVRQNEVRREPAKKAIGKWVTVDRDFEHMPHSTEQYPSARLCQLNGRDCRVDTGLEQYFIGPCIADPGQPRLVNQHQLCRRFSSAEPRLECRAIEIRIERVR